MFVPSRLAFWRVFAIAIVINLVGFGSSSLRAQGQGCGVQQKDCPPPVLREKPTVPPPESCCPVDPKDVKKAQKAAEHAQHEAAEECKRQQRAAHKAQERVDKAQAKGTDEINKANAKYEQDRADAAQAQAKLDSLTGSSNQAVAQTPSTNENDIMRSKPSETPMTPEAAPLPAPAPMPAPEATPAPAPTPAPESTIRSKPEEAESTNMPEQTQQKPKQLPKTASPLELIGLIGLVSMTGGYLTRFFRG
jgi:hypothetical protein